MKYYLLIFFSVLINPGLSYAQSAADCLIKEKEQYVIDHYDNGKVLIIVQGGPDQSLDKDVFEYIKNIQANIFPNEKDRATIIAAHQAQTLCGDLISSYDIPIKEATIYSDLSVEIINNIIEKQKSYGNEVYLIGYSYGTLLIQDYFYKYGNTTTKNLLMVGRIHMEEKIWSHFGKGYSGYFDDNGHFVEDFSEKGYIEKNNNKIASILGRVNYIEKLDNVNFKNTAYIYSSIDERIGPLNKNEISFLKERDAKVISLEYSHEKTMLFKIREGIAWLISDLSYKH